jgi:hypothetical protein
MKKFKTKSGVEYFIKGKVPKIVIQTGTHGDEYGVIQSVEKAIRKYETQLQDFIFVPEVSPTAVKAKTRVNIRGSDLNRIFTSESKDQEVQDNMTLLEKYPSDFVVSFHEDPEHSDIVYVYDNGFEGEDSHTKIWLESIRKYGIKPLNGSDDPTDPALDFIFTDGYRFFPYKGGEEFNGMVVTWVLGEKLSQRFQIVEIPGQAEQKLKDKLVDDYFEKVLLTLK